jgi:LPPG:FO 2-phospho-L-lactate transferase
MVNPDGHTIQPTVLGPLVLALAGGVGGAKLALGLAECLTPGELVIGVNTGDDEEFHGLHVSPDLDTVMYTLAGLSNTETGWGLRGDTFNSLEMLNRYGADAWFNLGDQDLATHIRRTQLLRSGATLSEVTVELCQRLGVKHPIVPMSDEPVQTILETDEGELPMQQYFVRRRAQPKVAAVRYAGAVAAKPSPGLNAALGSAKMIVVCPSNPALSVAPILAVPGVRESLEAFTGPRVAVSPIVGGDAVKGPAGKIMAELGLEVSVVGVAREYREICSHLVIDRRDEKLAPAVAETGLTPIVTNTIMESLEDKTTLAGEILAFLR